MYTFNVDKCLKSLVGDLTFVIHWWYSNKPKELKRFWIQLKNFSRNQLICNVSVSQSQSYVNHKINEENFK